MPHRDDCENCRTASGCDVFQSLDELDFERGIWAAAHAGDLDRLRVLLGRGEDVNRKDAGGYAALHYAARNGHVGTCEFLLRRGACVDATTRAGQATALHRASSAGKLDVVKLLLQNGADVAMKDSDGKTALHRAAEKQDAHICELLLKVDPNIKREIDNKSKLASDYAISDTLKNILIL